MAILCAGYAERNDFRSISPLSLCGIPRFIALSSTAATTHKILNEDEATCTIWTMIAEVGYTATATLINKLGAVGACNSWWSDETTPSPESFS